ncbi:MAG: methyltransferase domain-containing protein [Nitrososphaerales archaeon]
MLERFFPQSGSIELLCCDVDLKADLDVFCDAHELPFADESFQAIVITAVLQHVLNPQMVTKEMFRVLSVGGLVYSEVAFMQQVCEGAYDFTRYSLSGHRVLLSQFRELSAGIVAGPATAMVWSIENLFLSAVERRWLRVGMKAIVRVVFSWLKYLDYLLQHRRGAADGASCTYFLGVKDSEARNKEQRIIDNYIGAKHLRHV